MKCECQSFDDMNYYILLLILLLTTSSANHQKLDHAIKTSTISKVRRYLRSTKPQPPHLWSATLKGNPQILKLLLKATPTHQILQSRHPRSGGTLLHAACFEGNFKIIQTLLKVKNSVRWIDIQDRIQHYTPVQALIHGWSHQFLNFHNMPLDEMLQNRKERIGNRQSFNSSLALLLPHVPNTKLLAVLNLVIDLQWIDGIQLVVSTVQSRKMQTIVTWSHITRSIQNLFNLIVRLSKWLTKHGNVAVDENILQKYPSDVIKFNSLHFIGLEQLENIVHADGYSYNRKEMNEIFFTWANVNLLKPLLSSKISSFDADLTTEESRGTELSTECVAYHVDNETPLHAAGLIGFGSGLVTLLDTLSVTKTGRTCLKQWINLKNSKNRTPLASAYANGDVESIGILKRNGGTKRNQTIVMDPIEIEIEIENINGGDGGSGKDDENICDLDVIDWNDENRDELFEWYYYSNTPVKIQNHGITNQWPGFQKWKNINYFHNKFKHRKFHAFGHQFEKGKRSTSFKVSIRDFVKYNSNKPWLVETDTSASKNGNNGKDSFVKHVYKMTGRFQFYEDLLTSTSNDGQYSNYQFMIAPKGTGASPHFHNSGLNVLFTGSKIWKFWSPFLSFYSTQNVDEWFTNTRDKRLNNEEGVLTCVQRPGDLLFVPNMWGHAVLSLEDYSIGFAHLYNT